jgi:hypothetical protein
MIDTDFWRFANLLRDRGQRLGDIVSEAVQQNIIVDVRSIRSNCLGQ